MPLLLGKSLSIFLSDHCKPRRQQLAVSWSVLGRKRRWRTAVSRNSNSASSHDVLVHLLFLVLLACFPSFSSTQSPLDPCSLVQCGQGSCKVSNSFPFFECECYPGWMNPQFLKIDLPFSIVPNSCFLVWCSEGQCVCDGLAHNHTCECNDGSNNLLSLKGLPCFKECSLGADCKGVSFGRSLSPPRSSASPNSRKGSESVQSYGTFLLAAVALIWI